MSARRSVLAELLEAVETETPYGGRSVAYTPLGTAWLTIGGHGRRERREAGAAVVTETLTVETRVDARLTVERVLRFCGDDWRIRSRETRGGRSILTLERTS